MKTFTRITYIEFEYVDLHIFTDRNLSCGQKFKIYFEWNVILLKKV